MHQYWRLIEELKYLGERWDIVDPSILRCYLLWKQRHCEALAAIQSGLGSTRIGEHPILCDCSKTVH